MILNDKMNKEILTFIASIIPTTMLKTLISMIKILIITFLSFVLFPSLSVSQSTQIESDEISAAQTVAYDITSQTEPKINIQEAQRPLSVTELPAEGVTETTFLNIQRQYYLDAGELLDNKDYQNYFKLKRKLSNYPLLPYLEYQEILDDLPNKPYLKIDQYLDQNRHSYLGESLLKKWLAQLAREKRWHEYRSYYDENITSTSEQCLYIWSLVQTGVPQALQKASLLWNVGESQPSSCNPLFNAWKDEGYLTEELIWSRYQKTSRTKKNMRLIRYLKRIMSPESQLLATKYEHTISHPENLKNIENFNNSHPFTKKIVHSGLLKYVNKDSETAHKLWKKHQDIFSFTPEEIQQFNFILAKRKAFDNKPLEAQNLLSYLSQEDQTTIIEIVLRLHLKNRQWQPFYSWLNLLSAEERLSDRWQYWAARYYQQADASNNLYLPIYQKLALTRGYYGFLSADFLNKPYNLQDSPSIIDNETLLSLQQNSAVQRIRELYAINKIHTARNEWLYTTKNFSKEQFLTLAQLTNQWGWHRKSIEAMAAATSWDDLAIRFPLAHQHIIDEQAAMTSLPSTLIFAIARQESAWEKDAQSSAGAMGLMQILPRTAKETAKKAGIKYKKEDLLTPEKNIILGSRYISSLLERFENNRITAIAAYNAGPSRVNSWLKETEENLPHDIWIEVIPYGETRKYVQNVLSYAVVYGHQTGNNVPLLTELERKRPL
jgi:soluble lytic murein transglycosylase